jgi:HSP20 family molecular chaperone IbpA
METWSQKYTPPAAIDTKRILAKFANGVLQLELPKTEEVQARSVKVAVTAA